MKLYPKAKPVKIRMEYRGKEHYSLDSILTEFDLFEIYKLLENSQFIRWLQQLNEDYLVESLDSVLIDIKNGNKPDLQELLMAFYPDLFNGERKTFKELYNYFNSIPQGQNIAKSLLRNEYEKDYKSIEVNEILRGFNEDHLKSQGYAEYELYKTNYQLAKEGHNDAKKFVLDKFKWIKDFDSLEILFFRRIPGIKDIEDLPFILSFWKENGFNEIFNNYINNHSEFLSSHEKISEFLPNIKYHKRFRHLNQEEIQYLCKAINFAKEGRRFPLDTKGSFSRIKSYLNIIDNLRQHISDFRNTIYFDYYNYSEHKITDIYDFTIINIGKVFLTTTPIYSKKYNTVQYYSKKAKKDDYLATMKAVLDAYLYSESEFKRNHPDLPYIY